MFNFFKKKARPLENRQAEGLETLFDGHESWQRNATIDWAIGAAPKSAQDKAVPGRLQVKKETSPIRVVLTPELQRRIHDRLCSHRVKLPRHGLTV